MNEKDRTFFIEVTKELMAHPLGVHYSSPVDLKAVPDYRDYVTNPQDFGTILDRLEKKKYKTNKAYMKDMMLVFSNSILYSGTDGIYGKCATHLQNVFKKLLRKRFMQPSLGDWYEYVLNIQNRIDKLLLYPPSQCPPVFPVIDYDAKLPVSEVAHITTLAKNITDPKDLSKLLNIITHDNFVIVDPNQTEFVFDFERLSPQTQHAVAHFVLAHQPSE